MSSQQNLILSLYSSQQTVFTLAGIALAYQDEAVSPLSQRLNYYVQRGRLLNLRRGIYAKPGYNPEELACQLYTPCYLSLEYVLQRAGVVFQYDSQLTAVGYLSRTVDVDGREYAYHRIKGTILANLQGIEQRANNINIATPERAFLDVLYLNKEYHFDNLHPLHRRQVEALLPIYRSRRLAERVANLLDAK